MPEFIGLLREHDIGLVVADTVEWPLLMDVTSDFVYCRLYGSEQLYASGYTDEALTKWAMRLEAWALGADAPDGRLADASHCAKAMLRDVFVYFDNDAKVRAPADARTLRRLIMNRLPQAARERRGGPGEKAA